MWYDKYENDINFVNVKVQWNSCWNDYKWLGLFRWKVETWWIGLLEWWCWVVMEKKDEKLG